MRDEQLVALVNEATRPFPRVPGDMWFDLDELDDVVMGVASHYEQNTRPMTVDHATMLVEALDELDLRWPDLPSDDVAAYVARRRAIALYLLEHRLSGADASRIAVKGPVFVVSDDSSVMLFPNVDRAVRQMEAIDVRNGEYRVYDADGRRLGVHAASDDSPIVIRQYPGRRPEPDELRRILREHLLAVREARPEFVETGPEELDRADLPTLIAAMETVERRFRERSRTAILRRRLSAIGRRLVGGKPGLD